ncbi:hypothetical protein LCGC14_2093660 [marine sediment metagenome]|uniref:Radical SAM core domain-containing protein n=1 Tax=marine sediment metagenome TaxID=412755 RepID=A0A0F9EBX8_9ZZZZ
MRKTIKISDDCLKIAEIFVTVQGEGPNTGIPVVFVRLQLCNLSCRWCDTPYTWNWEGTDFKHDTKDYEQKKYDPRKEIITMTPDEVLNKVKELAGKNVKRVIWTGGEPLIQQRSYAFIKTLQLLTDNGFKIEVETNGTLKPSEEVQPYIDQYNVSPKLENSGNTLKVRRKDKPYEFFTKAPNAYFKFVVMDEKDMEEIQEIQKQYNIPSSKILLMPEGRTEEETKARAQKLVKLCIKYGYRFCNRLQVWIWDGAVRGV